MILCDIYVGYEAVWYVSMSSTLVKKIIPSGWNIKIFVDVSENKANKNSIFM